MKVIVEREALLNVLDLWLRDVPEYDAGMFSVQGNYLVLREIGTAEAVAVRVNSVADRSLSMALNVGDIGFVKVFLMRLSVGDSVSVGVSVARPDGAQVKALTVRCGADTLRLTDRNNGRG